MTKRKLSKIIIIILFFSIFLFTFLIEPEEEKEIEVITIIEDHIAEEEIVEIIEKKPIEKKSYNDAIPYWKVPQKFDTFSMYSYNVNI